MKKLKKAAFGIAIAGSLLVPLVVVSSCSSSSSTDSIDYKITVKPNPEIDHTDIVDEKYKKLETLQKLFDGITNENKAFFEANIEIEIEQGELFYKIVLTPNKGYTINGVETPFSSDTFTLVEILLDITANKDIVLSQEDFNLLNDEDNTNDLPVLMQLFTGLDDTNIGNVKVVYTKNQETLTLRANDGFVFANNKIEINVIFTTHGQDTNLDITAISNPKLTQEEMNFLIDDAIDENDLLALQRIFTFNTEITLEDLKKQDKITFELELSTNIVTLMAKYEYTINGKSTLDSNKITVEIQDTVLEITPNNEPVVELSEQEFADLNDGIDPIVDLAILQKLFEGIKEDNIGNVDIAYDEALKKITLTAKEGFTFASGKEIHVIFGLEKQDTTLEITPNNEPVVELSEQEFADLNDGIDPVVDLAILQKLFTGLDDTNIGNVDIAYDEALKKITLTAKEGFTFASGKEIHVIFGLEKQDTTLEITPNNEPVVELSEQEFADLNDGIDPIVDLAILQKLFTGLDDTNIGNVVIAYNKELKKITLTANEGFTFASGKDINVIFELEKQYVTLDVVAKEDTDKLEFDENDFRNLSDDILTNDLETLKKIFIGIENYATEIEGGIITAKLDGNAVVLTAKDGYIFIGEGNNILATTIIDVTPGKFLNLATKNSLSLESTLILSILSNKFSK